ncbi:hypothetical protein PLICRDRAFT_107217 [Plicaturopsis crispa FD-325 SS-3]|nr:hypothetical protein PLICRDRAFT_107217 [Plicaturopsis crispa FD-325 SS-3]
MLPLSLFLTLFVAYPACHAINFPFVGRNVRGPSRRSLHSRADISGSNNGTVPIANTHNSEYISNITLGGQSVAVMLDTGSSDLWVAASIPNSTDTGKSQTLGYAIGQATGNIHKAQLQFDNYTVDDQAFLLVTNASSFSTDIGSQGYEGLVGLGPNSGSLIQQKVGDASGDNMLNRIFQQNKTSQNYITFLLSRNSDPGQTFTGQFTVSELVPGYENVTTMSKLSIEEVPGLTSSDQHWQILTDKDGIIGPDGKVIDVSSIVPKAPSKQLVVVLDSGFTLPQVPRAVSDAIYGRVQGAQWSDTDQLWTVPCAQMLNISFKFGGVTYPVHPLDTVSDDFNEKDSNGNHVCVGAFQPITSAFSLLGEYDMILGMGFLRNTYTFIDFGNYVSTSSNDRGNPYVQLLPLTDPTTAHADFVNVRMGGQDNTGASQYALLDKGQSSPESDAEKKQHYEEKVLSRWPAILAGCLVFVALVIGLCIWRCCCRRGRKGSFGKKGKKGGLPSIGGGAGQTAYQPLHDPGSSANVHMQPMGPAYGQSYGEGAGHHNHNTSYSGN